MDSSATDPHGFVRSIKDSGISIYDAIEIGDHQLWIPSPELEVLLNEGLQGSSLKGLPLRTRSKFVKQKVCESLGYPIPKSFRKTRSRFPGQCFDTYVQKSNNRQIWNEQLAPTGRYVMIRVLEDDQIIKVKVVAGDTLALLDTTGTLTQKYQARCIIEALVAELVSSADTERLSRFLSADTQNLASFTPIAHPQAGQILPIAEIFHRLRPLIGRSFADAGYDQERNRGAALHQLVCRGLGYTDYCDDGRFPDIRHQLLEVKLQTSPTIDLGLVRPDSTDPLDVPPTQRLPNTPL